MDISNYIGLTIKIAYLSDNRIYLRFDGDKGITIFDNGQSCCESRYISCDDDLSSLVGGKLVHIVTKAYKEEDEWSCHEKCFVEIQTDKGFVTFCTHNEHNGYYSGFSLKVEGL
jgi:hypothetical protein